MHINCGMCMMPCSTQCVRERTRVTVRMRCMLCSTCGAGSALLQERALCLVMPVGILAQVGQPLACTLGLVQQCSSTSGTAPFFSRCSFAFRSGAAGRKVGVEMPSRICLLASGRLSVELGMWLLCLVCRVSACWSRVVRLDAGASGITRFSLNWMELRGAGT